MKKLLFVYDRMMTGGTTTALLSLLYMLDYSRYSVDLLMFDNSGEYLSDIPKQVHILPVAQKPSRVKGLSVSKRKIIRTAANGGFIKALFAYGKYRSTPKGKLRNILMHYGVEAQVSISRSIEEQYDAAIGFIEGWAAHYVLSPKVKAHKKIIWVHPDYKDSYLIPEVDDAPFRYADAIVTVSEKCRINMQSFFPQYQEKICVIENMVSSDWIVRHAEETEANVDAKILNLCTVCRCDMDVKGLDRMINVISKLRDEGLFADARWHLIGDGKDYLQVENIVRKRELSEYIHLYGMKKNPLPYLKKMDLFVLPSRYEGKPVSITEALCLGVPCVVTNYTSAHEQISSGENGLIAPNSEQGLYDALKRILEDREYLTELREGAQKCAYDSKDELKKLYKILERSE